MTKLLAVASVVTMIALGACSSDPDQREGPIDGTDTIVVESERFGSPVDQADPNPADIDATTDPVTARDQDTTANSPDDATPLPEPGDGLEHPKAPDTTKVVPPPQD